jgi:N utilization substance protein B
LSARTKARKRALDALYAAALTGGSASDQLKKAQLQGRDQEAIFDYAETLVNGYLANSQLIDARIESLSDTWTLDRMPSVDKSILRLSAWEILFNDEVPNEVAISEAVALAGEYSTDESAKFVNGLLARLAKGAVAL